RNRCAGTQRRGHRLRRGGRGLRVDAAWAPARPRSRRRRAPAGHTRCAWRRVEQEAHMPRARARGVIGRAVLRSGGGWPGRIWMDYGRPTMIGRLNRVAIAVRDIAKAANIYRQTLGAQVSDPVPQPDHGVTTVFVTLPNTKIELLEPLGEASPIAKF